MTLARPDLRRICLVGARGVGKTTLIRSVIVRLSDFDFVVGSAVLRELAGADFARFDHLPPEVKHRHREDVIGWMEQRQLSSAKHILCDGHTALLDESTGRVAAVFTERDCRFYRELILLDASAEVVLARRRDDPSKRRSLDLPVIRSELEAERETSHRIAIEWRMTLHTLPFSDDPTTAQQLAEILR